MLKELFIKIKEWITNNSEVAIIVTFIFLIGFAFYDAAAASAGAIGFCAFLATYWQAKISREHNRLSVRPSVQFSFITDPKEPTTIGIINNGLGPAILDEVILVINGKKGLYADNAVQNELRALCKENGLVHYPVLLLKNSSLPINKKINLITFKNTIDSPILHDKADVLIRTSLNFEFKYESMYGEKFDVTFFGSDTTLEKID